MSGDGEYAVSEAADGLLGLDHTDFGELMRCPEFTGVHRTVLAGFASRWNKSTWMRGQQGYLEKACLAAACHTGSTGLSFCRCGLRYKDGKGIWRFQTCQMPWICPSCNLHIRVEKCKSEYLPAFNRAAYWYTINAGWQADPRKAGLHWVTKQDEKGRALAYEHWKPWADQSDAPVARRYGLEDAYRLTGMAEKSFDFAGRLRSKCLLNGLYVTFEWHLSFRPRHEAPAHTLPCYHIALPHWHGFGNRDSELTFDGGKAIYELYCTTCLRGLKDSDLLSYPDLEISRLHTQDNLKRWVNYTIKPMQFEQFYLNGLRNGCPVWALNAEFHQTLWDTRLIVRSPRKYGNLNPRVEGYIGDQQFSRMSKPKLNDLLDRMDDGDVTPKELHQYENHLRACEQRRVREQEKRRRREAASRLPDPELE